jgi:hypothetical protein
MLGEDGLLLESEIRALESIASGRTDASSYSRFHKLEKMGSYLNLEF